MELDDEMQEELMDDIPSASVAPENEAENSPNTFAMMLTTMTHEPFNALRGHPTNSLQQPNTESSTAYYGSYAEPHHTSHMSDLNWVPPLPDAGQHEPFEFESFDPSNNDFDQLLGDHSNEMWYPTDFGAWTGADWAW